MTYPPGSAKVEITEAVLDGENLLVVRVENVYTPADVPVRRHDWWN